jgi:hypothetical protein
MIILRAILILKRQKKDKEMICKITHTTWTQHPFTWSVMSMSWECSSIISLLYFKVRKSCAFKLYKSCAFELCKNYFLKHKENKNICECDQGNALLLLRVPRGNALSTAPLPQHFVNSASKTTNFSSSLSNLILLCKQTQNAWWGDLMGQFHRARTEWDIVRGIEDNGQMIMADANHIYIYI